MALAIAEIQNGAIPRTAVDNPAVMAVKAPGTAERAEAQTDARRRAFETLVTPHLDDLRRGAWRLSRDPLVMEDLVQEALLKGWRAFDTFRNGTNIRAWLLRILMNAYIDTYRKERRQPGTAVEEHVDELYLYEHAADGDTLRRAGDPGDLIVEPMMSPEVERALRALPEAFRQAVLLSDVHGLTTAEISRRLGVPIGTVMSRLHRARARLSGLLGEYARQQGYPVHQAGRPAGSVAEPAAIPWAAQEDSGAA